MTPCLPFRHKHIWYFGFWATAQEWPSRPSKAYHVLLKGILVNITKSIAHANLTIYKANCEMIRETFNGLTHDI